MVARVLAPVLDRVVEQLCEHEHRALHVLVVDPQFDAPATTEPQADRIRDVRNRYRSLPMIVYSVLAAQTLRPLVELGREGVEQLVLYGLDDDPQHLRQLLER